MNPDIRTINVKEEKKRRANQLAAAHIGKIKFLLTRMTSRTRASTASSSSLMFALGITGLMAHAYA